MNPNIPSQSTAHIFQPQHPNHRKIIIGFIIAIVVVIGLLLTLFLVKQQQDLRQRASGPVCPVDGASCSWDATSGATSYHYKVVNVDSGATVKEGDTTDTMVHFTSIPGTTFTCVVTASNVCGTGAQGEATATCPILSVTPTPTLTPTPTTTTTPTPTPIACTSTCTTDSDCSSYTGGITLSCINGQCRNPQCSSDNTCFCGSPTPTSTLTPTETVTPTQTVTPTETPSVTPSVTQTPTPSASVTPSQTQTPTPTTPQQTPGNSATPTTPPTVIVYNTTATPTTFLSPRVTVPVTGPGDKFLNIGLMAVEVTLVGALIFFAL